MEICFIHTQILVRLHVDKSNFHMKGFILGLALEQRRNVTRKSPFLSSFFFFYEKTRRGGGGERKYSFNYTNHTLSLSSKFSIWFVARRRSATAESLSFSTRTRTADAAREGDGERARDNWRRNLWISSVAWGEQRCQRRGTRYLDVAMHYLDVAKAVG